MAARKKPVPPLSTEERIAEAMLDQIPEVQPMIALDPEPSPTLHRMLARMQRDVEAIVEAEFARIEVSMAGAFAQLEERLAQADAELALLREQNASLLHARDRYDRALQAIKELARDADAAGP